MSWKTFFNSQQPWYYFWDPRSGILGGTLLGMLATGLILLLMWFC